jgi:hypothetical protein
MAATELYAATFNVPLSLAIGMVGAEQYARTFGIALTLAVAMSGANAFTAFNDLNQNITNGTVPANTSGVWVTLIGAGGAGGWSFGAAFTDVAGGGGGGGAGKIDRFFIPVASLGTTYSVSTPASTASSSSGGSASNGANATFSSGSISLTAGGGGGGGNGGGGHHHRQRGQPHHPQRHRWRGRRLVGWRWCWSWHSSSQQLHRRCARRRRRCPT